MVETDFGLAGILADHVRQLEDQDIVNIGEACRAANYIRKDLGMPNNKEVEQFLAA